jgi:hypothetical protein
MRPSQHDYAAISSGISVYAREPSQVVALTRVLYGLVGQSIDERSVAPLIAFTYANLQLTLDRVAHVPVACKAGCSHCCHGFVAAMTPEVIYLSGRFDPARLPATRAAVAATNAQTRDKSHAEREKMAVPCALLENGLCSVYADRPLTCRTGISTRADLCLRAHREFSGENIPRPAIYITMRRAYYVAFAGALRRAGLVYKPYEFNAALDFALNNPGAEADWLAGKDVLKGLPEDLGTDIFADPAIQAVYDAAFSTA